MNPRWLDDLVALAEARTLSESAALRIEHRPIRWAVSGMI